MAEVPSRDRIDAIMLRIQRKATLTDEEVRDLQSHVDQLERQGLARSSHHETTSHHHTSALLDVPGILER